MKDAETDGLTCFSERCEAASTTGSYVTQRLCVGVTSRGRSYLVDHLIDLKRDRYTGFTGYIMDVFKG